MPFSDEQPDRFPDPPARAKRADPPPTPSTDPTVADDRERQLDPRWVRAERLSGAILAAVLSALLLVAVVALGTLAVRGLPAALILLVGWLVASAGLTALLLTWPAVRYRHTSYRISERGIRIRRGVVWRAVSSVPRSRVQHTDVAQGPIERMFGLATLIVYTAGTHHASVSLSGLARETALRIRDHLIVGGEDDAV